MFLGDWYHFLCCDFFLWANVSFMIATICVWRGPTIRASHTHVCVWIQKTVFRLKKREKGVNYVEEKLSLGIFVAVNFARSSFWVFFVISDPQWKWHSGRCEIFENTTKYQAPFHLTARCDKCARVIRTLNWEALTLYVMALKCFHFSHSEISFRFHMDFDFTRKAKDLVVLLED